MKLAILGTRGIPARYGGFETFAEKLAIGLVRRGVDVTVFCPAHSNELPRKYLGVTLKYVKSLNFGSFSETLWDALCLWRARRDYDVVYLLGVGASFAAWLPQIYGTAVWINPDGIEWQRRKWNWLQRAYLAVAEGISVFVATKIIADAQAIATYLTKRYPRLKKISTIAYGAVIPSTRPNAESLARWSLCPNDYYLVVCRLEPENHVLEILDGFVKSRSIRKIAVLGNLSRRNSYINSLLRYKSDKVRFLGTIYDEEQLCSLRFHARAYLHGHSVGGTNPSLLEAMACSSLVLAHDNLFNREALEDCGLYWSTPDELASILVSVDGMRVDEERRKENARGIVSSRYLWNRVADDYVALIMSGHNDIKTTAKTPSPRKIIASQPKLTKDL